MSCRRGLWSVLSKGFSKGPNSKTRPNEGNNRMRRVVQRSSRHYKRISPILCSFVCPVRCGSCQGGAQLTVSVSEGRGRGVKKSTHCGEQHGTQTNKTRHTHTANSHTHTSIHTSSNSPTPVSGPSSLRSVLSVRRRLHCVQQRQRVPPHESLRPSLSSLTRYTRRIRILLFSLSSSST